MTPTPEPRFVTFDSESPLHALVRYRAKTNPNHVEPPVVPVHQTEAANWGPTRIVTSEKLVTP